MKLCKCCINEILESAKSWDYHKSYASLKENSEWSKPTVQVSERRIAHGDAKKTAAEKERCLFCSTLRHDVETIAPDLKAHDQPVYRWSMRSLARIRESMETVVITFRQVPKAGKEGNATAEIVKLPTRNFYFLSQEDINPLPTTAELGASTNPATNGGHQIRSWVETCNETHGTCMKRRKAMSTSSRQLPTRLLDISGPAKSSFKVIETLKTPVRGPYVSLSHCWGKGQIHTLIKSREKQFMKEGIPWHMLTQNFQDAIEVARFLDIEYIWIDSLCIIQGKPEDGGDFHLEASKMHQVYRNSYCNVAIVDSAESGDGAFRKRDAKDIVPVRYKAKNESAVFGSKAWRVVPGDLWDSELLKTKLYRRGWVFQERMLAPRILHFANRQIFWDCPSLSACESLPSGLPPSMDGTARPDRHWRGRLQEPEESKEQLAGASDDSLVEFWKTAVAKYTSCALTKGSDKLIAMWGIAKLLRDAMGVEYGKGLWEENLEDQLTWRVAECTLRERPSESHEWSLERNIPSWSWASMDGQIEVQDPLTDKPHYTVKDHSGQSLRFDLKGVKRYLPPAPPRFSDMPSLTQGRVHSDSFVEQIRRSGASENRDKELEDPETKVDRDAEPEFHKTSIPIQGHVGRGRLVEDQINNRWLLDIHAETETEIEAFPDIVLARGRDTDWIPFFVVLSAKKMAKSNATAEIRTPQQRGKKQSLGHVQADMNEDFEVTGTGVLMKESEEGNDYFQRTGAFSFRNVSKETFAILQQTFQSENLSKDMYKPSLGRKFWLE